MRRFRLPRCPALPPPFLHRWEGGCGAAPGTAALSGCGDEVSSGRWRAWLSPPAPSPPRARAALPGGARERRRDRCGTSRPALERVTRPWERGASGSAGAAPHARTGKGLSVAAHHRVCLGLDTDPGAQRALDTCRAAVTEANNTFFLPLLQSLRYWSIES